MKKLPLIVFMLVASLLQAQFYNGMPVFFGKNRVQYHDFNWRYIKGNNYEVYFYDRGINLGKYIADKVESTLAELEDFYNLPMKDPLIFIVYNNIRDFRQTNIGLETEGMGNIAGRTQIIDNKVFLFFEGSHKQLDLQLKKVISEVFVKKALYGTLLSEKMANSSMLELPEWFEKGLVSFSTQQWSPEIENFLRDYFQTHKKININNAYGDNARILGHSFWYFVVNNYGDKVISQILFFTKFYKNPYKAFSYVLGVNFKELNKQWFEFFKNYFSEQKQELPSDFQQLIKKPKKNAVYQNFAVSPDGKNAAVVINKQGKFKLYIYNLETGKRKKIFKQGQKLDQIIDYSYPVLTWDFKSKKLAFVTETKNSVFLNVYNLKKDEIKHYNILYADKVLWVNYSPNNRYLVYTALNKGYTDLFVYDFYGNTIKRLTYDLADDLEPAFLPDSRHIIFRSNRRDTVNKFLYNYEDNPLPDNDYDLFTIDLKTKKIDRITNTPFTDETQPYALSKKQYIYLSDTTGIINRWQTDKDSTIAFVDTAIHYFYFFNSKPVSAYPTDILQQKLIKKYLSEIFFKNKRYRPVYRKINDSLERQNPPYSEIWLKYRKTQIAKISKQRKKEKQNQIIRQKLDSLKPFFEQKFNTYEDPTVDINNYVFEFEKDTLFASYFFTKLKEQSSDSTQQKRYWVYQPVFFLSDMMGQMDFSNLSQTYQTFTGGPFYFNSGMNYFTKFELNELFEDYRIIGGFRLGLFQKNFEYILSIENLRKRLDKQLVYYRQSYTDVNDTVYTATKDIVNQMSYILKYPFNQVFAVRFSTTLRYERKIPLSREYVSLVADPEFSLFASEKAELIFDNTRELQLNLYDGIRYKVFAEIYKQIKGDNYWMSVWGFDFRAYKNLFRHAIVAVRFAGSTSFGSGKLVYYLGGVDNWIGLFQPVFNSKIIINPNENYLFQAVATNMRGFKQNIRNGNSFLLMNNEVRLPIVNLITNRPVSSQFFNTFQLVGFFDIGSAWSGTSPWDKEANAYNTLIVRRGNITIRVDVNRPPFVFGYGFGLRFKLLGYFTRLDWAWGQEGYYKHPRIFYLSFNLDF